MADLTSFKREREREKKRPSWGPAARYIFVHLSGSTRMSLNGNKWPNLLTGSMGGTRGIILKDKEGKDIDCQLLVLAHLNFPNSLMSDTLP